MFGAEYYKVLNISPVSYSPISSNSYHAIPLGYIKTPQDINNNDAFLCYEV